MIAILLLCIASDPWADGSPAVEYGPGAGYGQSYYPENILGPPDPDATPTAPSFGEENLLTLGKDGWVVLEFTDNSIVNGSGADFTVFENVMDTGSGYFQECAFVEVSQDGQYWVLFPWDATTKEGLAGLMPTTGEDPTNPEVSGGDQFDLEDLGLEWVRFVRLTDCGDAVPDGGLFDLDAVAAVNWSTGIEKESSPSPVSAYLFITSPFSSTFTVSTGETGTLSCYTVDGRLAGEWSVSEQHSTVSAFSLPAGVLLFVLNESVFSTVKLSR
ncbi:MAG: hypothetical protein U9P42_05790 [Candidatus Fermentibacteria bacterium]|nr:hypothetical protein [Candidatus Fermentibacteria bacterium]